LSLQLCMQKVWIFKKIENENELKIKILSRLKGQIILCMLKGGLSTN
jgi:hypothetical protein